LWLRSGLPESPRWLVIKGKASKAFDIIRTFNPNIQREQFDELARAILVEHAQEQNVSPLQLFRPGILKSTIFTSGFFTCYTLSFYAVTIYGPVILKNLGGLTTPTQLALGAGLYFLFASIGGYTNVFIVDRVGRRSILFISFAGMAGILLVLAAIYPPTFIVGLALLSIFQFFQAFGPGVLWASYIPEVFPTRLRASGHGMATFTSRLGAVGSSFLWVWAVATFTIGGAFVVHATFALLGIVLTAIFGVETRQRTLELINAETTGPAAKAEGLRAAKVMN